MTATVTIIQKPVHAIGPRKVLAIYAFEDSTQALNVARTFEPVYVNNHQEILTAEYRGAREGADVVSLHIAYTLMFSDNYEQSHWLISDAEIASTEVMRKAFEDYNSAVVYDLEAIKEQIATGEPYYTFDPHLVEHLNRSLWA